jgi:AcrR family transcriptional regulator
VPTTAKKKTKSPSPRQSARTAGRLSIDEKLLHGMEKLLAQGESFSTVSVERLAETAGIARATFYLHYRDKADLVAHLVRQVRKEIVAAAGVWFEDASRTTRKDIERALRGILGVYRTHHVILSAMSQTASTNEEVARLSHQMWEELCEASRKALRQLKASKRAHPQGSERVADFLTLAINHCATLHPQMLRGRKFEETVEAWTHISWNALAADR